MMATPDELRPVAWADGAVRLIDNAPAARLVIKDTATPAGRLSDPHEVRACDYAAPRWVSLWRRWRRLPGRGVPSAPG